ncbi:MAG: sialidase family protein [Bacillota bacterium]|nr:sialidase family protein [Bacillota bacterium]
MPQPNPLCLFPNLKETGRPYHRIPALVRTAAGSLLAACELRSDTGDWSAYALSLRRSTDGGRSWSAPLQITVPLPGVRTVNNPVLIACQNGQVLLIHGSDYRCVWLRLSQDDGRSFGAPQEITDGFQLLGTHGQPLPYDLLAPGPGHGIEMPDGTLLLTAWFACGGPLDHFPSATALIRATKNDLCEAPPWTWQSSRPLLGDNVDPDGRPAREQPAGWLSPNEACVAPLSPTRVLINVRHRGSRLMRWQGCSSCPYDSLTGELRPDLPDPACFGSLAAAGDTPSSLYFVNCQHPTPGSALPPQARVNLRLQRSDDAGKTWHQSRTLVPRAGYADLALAPSDSGCGWLLYEAQEEDSDRLSGIWFQSFRPDDFPSSVSEVF